MRRMLAEQGIDDRLVLPLDDRPTTLKERYIGRAQDRHPQQMIRVDYETRDPIPAVVEARFHAELPAALAWADVVLISDYGKGVCTPTLLRAVIDAGACSRRQGARRPDPIDRLLALPGRALHDPESTGSPACHRHDDRAGGGRPSRRQVARGDARDGGGPRHARPRRHGAGSRRWPRRAAADAPAAGLRHHRRRRHGARGRRPLPGQWRRLRRGRRAGQRRRRPRGREVRRRHS